MITKKEFTLLKEYESYLSSALKLRCMHSLSYTAQDLLYNIYEAHTGKKLHRNYSCSRCQLNIATLVAKLYFAYKNNQENADGK